MSGLFSIRHWFLFLRFVLRVILQGLRRFVRSITGRDGFWSIADTMLHNRSVPTFPISTLQGVPQAATELPDVAE